ncbi:MAG: DUF1573 domain-containing protein [Bacteroidales bacterium]
MKKNLLFLVCSLLLGISSGNAQDSNTGKATIAFENLSHDFGTIKEEVKYAVHNFTFKNTGTAPLILNSVRASCGCTTPKWNREPIAPGASGNIEVRYSTSNRPGSFRKTITVGSNASNPQVVLKINGTVTPREKTIKELYPRYVGNMSVKTDQIAFGRIKDSAPNTKTVEVANATNAAVKVDFSALPSYISAKMENTTLEPQAKSSIEFTFDPKAKGVYGSITEPVNVKVNGKEVPFTLSATIEEDFSGLSEKELINAPVAILDPYVVNFGSLAKGTEKQYEFSVKNEGKSPLIIRQASSGNEELTVTAPSKPIKSGHTGKVVVDMKLSGNAGRKSFVVSIIQNDPKRPISNVRITGNMTD